MKLVQFQWDPSEKQLRQFGIAALVCLPILGWLVAGFQWPIFLPFAAVGLLLAALAFVAPKILKPVFIVASLITFPIGLIVGELLLAIIFYVIVTPVALFFRLIGRDALDRKIDRAAKSYWVPIQPATDAHSYYRQS